MELASSVFVFSNSEQSIALETSNPAAENSKSDHDNPADLNQEKTQAVAFLFEKSTVDSDDSSLLRQAEELVARERFLAASELLKKVSDTSLYRDKHHVYLKVAQECDAVLQDLLSSPERSGWKKQGETHGRRDSLIYYKVDPGTCKLHCRIETPIESSLLNPLLAVFNESDLYATWMPSWKTPRLGIRRSVMLKELGRGNQVVQVTVDMPFPLKNRECVLHAFAVDDIDGDSEGIVVKIKSLDKGGKAKPENDGTLSEPVDIPPVEKGVTRIDMDAGILIRSCPPDHPCYAKTRAYFPDEPLLLVSVTQSVDAHVTAVPVKIVNFFTRTVIGTMWSSLLQVAEDVKEGKRPQHSQKIQEKRDLYEWVQQRAQVMLSKLDDESAMSRTTSMTTASESNH